MYPSSQQLLLGFFFQVFKFSDMNLLTLFSFCPVPAASQKPEAGKEPEQADEQEQKKKKKKKKVKSPEEDSFEQAFKPYALSKKNEAQSNGGTAVGSSDSSLQVSLLSF